MQKVQSRQHNASKKIAQLNRDKLSTIKGNLSGNRSICKAPRQISAALFLLLNQKTSSRASREPRTRPISSTKKMPPTLLRDSSLTAPLAPASSFPQAPPPLSSRHHLVFRASMTPSSLSHQLKSGQLSLIVGLASSYPVTPTYPDHL